MKLSNYGEFPADLPVIAEDELFLYPFMISPLFLSDENNIKAATKAIDENSLVIVCSTKPSHEGERTYEALYDSGVIGSIMRKVSLPDGRVKVLFQGLARAKVLHKVDELPLVSHVDIISSTTVNSLKIDAILEILREKVRTLSSVSNYFPPDLLRTIEENHDNNRIIDLICSSIKLKKEQAYKLFVEVDTEKRFLDLIDYLIDEIEANKLQKEIRSKVHTHIEKVNKEYFLKEQLKQIQKELGTDTSREEELEEYRKKLEAKKGKMAEDAYKEIHKQIERFSKMHPDSSDASMTQTYLDWVLEVPFGEEAKKSLKISDVETQLDLDHFSLEKPKKRIVEYFAVKELLELRGMSRTGSTGAILCFSGPPGVGKTSLANSIATALKRPLVRIALGGLEDVNELRGHRRTYVGAMPGRITQGLIDAKKMNPIIVLDEIDKVSRSQRGDPTAALLEILDPEQNKEFRDYYLNFNIDLSNVIFIATANDVGQIPAPLRDRMEFITVSSYTPQEKFEIAKRYLIPQELKKHGLKNSEVSISKPALVELIHSYTREAGVRNLRRRIADMSRKAAKDILEHSDGRKISVSLKNLKDYFEKSVFEIEKTDKVPVVGVVNGLAWTAVGGDVLKIESIRIKGKGELQLTGSLGDVMKESARIAMSVVKTLIDSKKLKISEDNLPRTFKEIEENTKLDASEVYRRYDLHIHVPDGATPKDGPSAGIAMVSVISSILSSKKIRSEIAMTGEVSLSGDVLPIGGLKEKLIAAHKAGMSKVLIPAKNYERDLEDIPKEVRDSMEIVGVTRVEEVLKQILI
ncbi:MAG: endopeptidase La [Epsilonproteobacteria bacterium]|nr:endopeptidase La [Campylobacterota bacterium]PIP10195.1 MAG: endopeptidase La [Sulfurimonas sp. CG23_combo_of_CG06-09_8_20_14_all_36_33]PIS26484.1 MAG: endopeptidase La [Sulfurimonas sp. CG08_land_8_20_14_0_20_36_33]PIU33946.1 MAG: endopeptidase La [Sulfurimonas sp. CG07_land_8_20_14_0_80_36_56]PIV03774.1 MAG: endopeptidase La [Sulfurimonas sp. CG03_land_8_20_14_0_80_36_25]PIV34081.1 MAG: endopeptidase La [Sulfurimonas sp. CG02_land_8_20_14_3_00_36_67]PIV61407.1 MAG: endopeptidase La [Sulf